jgi:hypothetical protein
MLGIIRNMFVRKKNRKYQSSEPKVLMNFARLPRKRWNLCGAHAILILKASSYYNNCLLNPKQFSHRFAGADDVRGKLLSMCR